MASTYFFWNKSFSWANKNEKNSIRTLSSLLAFLALLHNSQMKKKKHFWPLYWTKLSCLLLTNLFRSIFHSRLGFLICDDRPWQQVCGRGISTVWWHPSTSFSQVRHYFAVVRPDAHVSLKRIMSSQTFFKRSQVQTPGARFAGVSQQKYS